MATGGATWGIVKRGNLKGQRVAVRNGVVMGGHKARPGDVSIGGPPTRGEAIIQTTRGAQQAAVRRQTVQTAFDGMLTSFRPPRNADEAELQGQAAWFGNPQFRGEKINGLWVPHGHRTARAFGAAVRATYQKAQRT